MTIAEIIVTKRKEKNITQQELADLLFVSNKTISKWETGRGVPEITIIPKLAKVLDVSIDELLGEFDGGKEEPVVMQAKESVAVEERNNIVPLIVRGSIGILLLLVLFAKIIQEKVEMPSYLSGFGLFDNVTVSLSGYGCIFDNSINSFYTLILFLSNIIFVIGAICLITFALVEYFVEGDNSFKNTKKKYFYISLVMLIAIFLTFIFTLIESNMNFLAGGYMVLLVIIGYAAYEVSLMYPEKFSSIKK